MTGSSESEVIIRSDGVNEKTTKDVITVPNGQTTKKPSTSISSVSTSTRSVVHTSGSVVRFIFPVLAWVTHYPVKKYFLYGDLWAGIYTGLYLIPQCIAYSVMSTTSAIFAFYTCIIASVLYAVIGSNRRLSYGVFSLVSAVYLGMVIDRVRPSFKGTPDVVGVVAIFTFMVGLYSAAAGLLRVGSFVRFVPYEVLSGFRAGLYVLVFSMQLNSILGLDIIAQMDLGEGKELLSLPRLFSSKLYPHVKDNTSWYCVCTSLFCIIIFAIFRLVNYYWFVLFGQRARVVKNVIRLVPIEFILVAIGFVVAYYNVDRMAEYKMPLASYKIGNDTEGIFDITHINLHWPNFKDYFHLVWSECITATVLTVFYAHSLALDHNIVDTEVKPFSTKVKRQINPRRVKYIRLGWKQYCPNRELLSQAIINVVASFFKCLPSGVSATRSNRMRTVGGRSQIAGLVSSIVVVGVWYGLNKYLPFTPQCIVASVVAFDAALAFIDEVLQLRHFWSISSIDPIVWLLTLASFIFLNLEMSLYFSLGLGMIVYLFRSKLFSPILFEAQRHVLTSANTNLIIPESVLNQSYSRFDTNTPDEEDDGANGGGNDIFMFVSPSKLKDIQIFQMDQHYLTISNVDGFVRDVFRKLSSQMKTETCTRLVFDCRNLSYLDWPSVRLVKATVMRVIEISESWKQAPKPLFIYDQSAMEEKSDKDEGDKSEDQLVVVAFVFRTKVVQFVHNAGKSNVQFYPTLHKSLHIGMKGAMYSILSVQEDKSSIGDDSNNSNKDVPSTEKEDNKIFSRKQSEDLDARMNKANKVTNRPKLTSYFSTDENQNSASVMPLSFKQNDDEFSYTSSFGSNTSQHSTNSPQVKLETFTQPAHGSSLHRLSASTQSSSLETVLCEPSTSTAVIHYPPLSPPISTTIDMSFNPSHSNSTQSIPPPPPPPPPPPSSTQQTVIQIPKSKSPKLYNTMPRASVDLDKPEDGNNFRRHLENLLSDRRTIVFSKHDNDGVDV